MSQQETSTHQGEHRPLGVADEVTTKQHIRRRLLKAAGMAPVIYTLPAGAQMAAGSISCAGKSGNVLNVTRDGKNILVGGETFCTLPTEDATSGSTCTTLAPEGAEGREYIFEGNSNQGTITAGSCWTSLNLTG